VAVRPTGLPPHLATAERTLVMGVLNVTPDSFSDGGIYLAVEAAVTHAMQMVAAGADLVDVGGESTRPGAPRVDVEEERRRVLPVVRELVACDVVVSVDTMRAGVAATALDAGAHLVNDVSGGLADEQMARVVATAATPYVCMHWRAHSFEMAARATYSDVVTEVVHELGDRLNALADAGIDPDRVVVDPGLGFAKDAGHNWSLLAHLDSLATLGPVLVGASRKSFLGALLAEPDGSPRPPEQRDVATAVLSALVARQGVWAVRVHDVRPTVDALRVTGALTDAR
jgi:dihydropteroate synthase